MNSRGFEKLLIACMIVGIFVIAFDQSIVFAIAYLGLVIIGVIMGMRDIPQNSRNLEMTQHPTNPVRDPHGIPKPPQRPFPRGDDE